MAKVMRVIEAFSTDVDGVPRVFPEGHLFRSDDPVVKGRDRFLMDAEVYSDRALRGSDAVETATAAPGEKRSLRRARAKESKKRAEAAGREVNREGADDGEADPESGPSQVPGVNRKEGYEEPGDEPQTAEQKRSVAQVQKLGEEVNRSGADDGQADPESGDSQVPGVNYKKGYEVPVDVTTNEDKDTPKDVVRMGEEANREGADDGEKDPESGSNQVPGVNRLDPEDPDLPDDELPAGEKDPVKAPAKAAARKAPAKKAVAKKAVAKKAPAKKA